MYLLLVSNNCVVVGIFKKNLFRLFFYCLNVLFSFLFSLSVSFFLTIPCILENTFSMYSWVFFLNFPYILQNQFSSFAQSCLTLCDPMNRSTPGLPVHHQLLEFTQTHIHWVSDAIQPSHPGSSPSPPAPNPSQHQGLFQWVNCSHCSHEVAKVL